MNKIFLIAASLVATTAFAIAQDIPTTKAEKEQQEVTKGGTTAKPEAKPETGMKADTAAKDLTKGGTTANPEAKPETGEKHQ